MKRPPCRSPRIVLAWLIIAGCTTMLGCYHNRISKPEVWAPATELKQETVWSFFWGLKQQNIVPDDCHGCGLAEVTVSRDLGQCLISVGSLGMAVPITIKWRCAKCEGVGSDDF